ncbi:TIGR03087 family PEP-CTERM/XrtA system glycosyltransferase [Niveibacterium umoris]|uniref:Sugar transferase (PEP-CTERM/EpsH1 system associated) n=1 Tax=Niveibacterium umoris TaxID=1193620 RepID=A0A840BL32_9RHOO|nr:TIGR03087 family PEP-CTERM/XrtA system glycosyltransferase [Niveibacterium umoris]MBB4012332.1 sugar transferase (PEP-CTERM/EpsH1 system associated) [Niveibacterium umoris]
MTKPPLLYLVHRIPYPPNKGDKVRSFNLLKHYARHYRVFLATFIDDKADEVHADALLEWCEAVHCERLSPRLARLASLRGLVTGEALTLAYYRNRSLARWVSTTIATQGIRRAAVFCSSMMQYIEANPGLRTLADYCDVDSAKWAEYASTHSGPLSWLYRREGGKLLAFERHAVGLTCGVTFVSEAEAALFRQLAPECGKHVHAVSNGVDAEYFSPVNGRPSPFNTSERAIVFTGAMDYWPNVDAVVWFAREVWPTVSRANPDLSFWVVGMNPASEVKSLADVAGIRVTGSVPDVRPYLQHATAVVAPLRIARGIQNKVLEAMAMARPVIASSAAATGIDAALGTELLVADAASEFANTLQSVIDNEARSRAIGAAARARVVSDYSWEAHLVKLDSLFEGAL